MAVACDSNSLITGAHDYCCIPSGIQSHVIIYLLNQILGTGLTPQQLVENSAPYRKEIPDGASDAVMLYILCALADAEGA